MRESKRKKLIKRILIWCLTVILASAALVSATHAWLNRLADQTSAAGFSLGNNGTVMKKNYRIETYYMGMDGSWKLITADFERDHEEWKIKWDDHSAILAPGHRTEFKTEITSLVPTEQSVSLLLQGISIDKRLKDKAVIGVYEPEMILYDCNDELYFSDSGLTLTADRLPICTDQRLDGYGSMTVRWYVNISTEAAGGGFPALADGTTGIPITDDQGHYYFVNEYDSDGRPKEAYLCDEAGIVLNGNQEYRGNYRETAAAYIVYGDAGSIVEVSGMYAAIG